MKWFLFCGALCILIGVVVRYRRKTLLLKENEQRVRLGLPSLTEDEFAIDPVEKSVEYRGKINQHM